MTPTYFSALAALLAVAYPALAQTDVPQQATFQSPVTIRAFDTCRIITSLDPDRPLTIPKHDRALYAHFLNEAAKPDALYTVQTCLSEGSADRPRDLSFTTTQSCASVYGPDWTGSITFKMTQKPDGSAEGPNYVGNTCRDKNGSPPK